MASVSSKSEFQFFQKFVNKEKCLEFFKSKEIRKTTQLSGWQKLVKCKKCEHYDELHHMNSVTRLIFIINQQQQQHYNNNNNFIQFSLYSSSILLAKPQTIKKGRSANRTKKIQML